MNKIAPFLWFNSNAAEAADFYLSIFPNSRKLSENYFPDPMGGPAPVLITVELEIFGQRVTFMNGGPGHPLTDAFSFFILCEDQPEIDHYWALLTEGGSEIACGWCKDRFGLTWQVVPDNFKSLISTQGGMQAMMRMKKLDIEALRIAIGQ